MKTQGSFFEQNAGTYTLVGDVLLPDLSFGEAEQRPIGKYGRMRKRFLKEERPVVFSELLLSGKLYPHLLKIDETCEERIVIQILHPRSFFKFTLVRTSTNKRAPIWPLLR